MSEPAAPAPHEHAPPPQPDDSKAQLLQDATSTTLILPPAGFTGGVRGLVFFGVIWICFISFFTLVAGFTLSFSGSDRWESIFICLFFIPFWFVGIAVLLGALQSARRRCVFIVTKADGLTFSQVGPIKKSEKQWPPGSITRIHMDASGSTVNQKPIMQLKIHAMLPDAQGTPAEDITGILTGRDEPELKWIASTLREATAR